VRLSSPMISLDRRPPVLSDSLFRNGVSKRGEARESSPNGGSGDLYRGHSSERKGAAAPRTNPHHSRGQAHHVNTAVR
jgi:hypothetical protein